MSLSTILLIAIGVVSAFVVVSIALRRRTSTSFTLVLVLAAIVITTVAWGVPYMIERADQTELAKTRTLLQAYQQEYGDVTTVHSLHEVERVYLFIRNEGDSKVASVLIGSTWLDIGKVE